jgi:hypothetical protein
VGLVRGSEVTGDMALKQILGTPASSSHFLCFLAIMR